MAKKAYIGVENFTPRELPNGYTQVEYIESSGTQYIDTGFKPNHNTRVVADCYLDSAASTMSAFGAWTGTSTNAFIHAGKSDNSACVFFYGTGNTSISVSKTGRHLIDFNMNEASIDGVSASATTQTFSCTYSMFLMAYNSAGSAANKATGKLYSCRIYDNGVMVRDFVPCTNSSGTAGLYDLVNGGFYQNAGTGTFSAGSVHGSFARKIGKGYIGIENVARKIKKAYIGIGGLARPCWAGGELAYYGTITPLAVGQQDGAAASNGKYAIFAGGAVSGGWNEYLTAYDASLSRIYNTNGRAQANLAATNLGNYAIFGYGMAYGTSSGIYAYNQSLTKTSADGDYSMAYLAATNIGNYALFGGGYYGSGGYSNQVERYNMSLTRGSNLTLSKKRAFLAGTSIGEYALFAGGEQNDGTTVYSTVDAFNSSLTRTTAPSLSKSRTKLSGTKNGKYALFAGGMTSNSSGFAVSTVDAYDSSLTLKAVTPLSSNRAYQAATELNGFAIFGGGEEASGLSNIVEAYDESLTKTTPYTLNTARYRLAAATIGEFALFGGGSVYNSNNIQIIVDVYTIV